MSRIPTVRFAAQLYAILFTLVAFIMRINSNSGQRLISRDSGLFTVGWVGLGSGLILRYIGSIDHASTKLDRGVAKMISPGSLEYISTEYGKFGSGGVVYMILIGYVVFLVSGVSLLFAYEGPQLYRWILLFIGSQVVLYSTVVSDVVNIDFSVFWISIIKGGFGFLVCLIALCLLDFGSHFKWHYWAGKSFLLLAFLTASCAFPVGVLSVQKYATYAPCLVLDIGSVCFLTLSSIIFVWVYARGRDRREDTTLQADEEESQQILIISSPT